jgi:hypothetical protein
MLAIKKVSPMARRTTDAKHTLREILLLQYLGKHPNVSGLSLMLLSEVSSLIYAFFFSDYFHI